MFGSNDGRGKARAFVQREMQAEQRPVGVLEAVEFLEECRRQLRPADQCLEGLMHVERGSDEALRPHGAAVGEDNAAGAAAFDQNAVDRHLRRERAAGGNECFHQPARQIERSALAELVTGVEIEGADHRSHRARLRQRVGEPGAEQ